MRVPCSHASRRARVLGTLLCTLAFVGCGSLDEASAVPEQGTLGESKAPVVHGLDSASTLPGGSYSYSASNTNDAQQNTVNQNVSLSPGQTIDVSTCSDATGDTYLRLYGPSATQVAANDDSCFNGEGSRLSYTTITSGTFQIRAGCASAESCSGTVTWTIE